MAKSYAQNKRLNSLAKRYFSDHDAYLENLDLNEYYNLDLRDFVEKILIEKCGYKKDEQEFKVHRPRKIGRRPEKRKAGQRPPRIGEKVPKKQKHATTDLAKKTEEIDIQLPTGSQNMPLWKKRLWRKIMMAVHPDRIDTVSVDEKDKFQRVKIRECLQSNDTDAMIIASAKILSIDAEMPNMEQERKMRTAIMELKKKNQDIFESAPWIWGESFTSPPIRAEVIKAVLINNSIQPPPDNIILEYVKKNIGGET